MRNYQNSYVYGSVAYQLERKYEENQKEQRTRVKRANKELLAYRLSLFVSILVVFIMSAGLMTGYSNISLKQDNIQKLEKELKLAQDNLCDAKLAIAETIDTKNVARVATEKLRMVKAADYQIINIEVPKENYTVKY